MAKINILFDGTDYSIDEANLESATAELKTHLSSVMNGTGATINFGGTAYSVDSTKLSGTTNSFIAHLETLKGGEGGGLVEGETYTFKSNLNDIDESYFMKTPSTSIPTSGAYNIALFNEKTAFIYLTPEAVAEALGKGENDANTAAWMINAYSEDGTPLAYIYYTKIIANTDNEIIDNDIGWVNMLTNSPVDPPSVTISAFDESYGGYPLDELAVFFDIPSAGGSGVIEYGKEITFKKDITVEDFEYYIENATAHIDHPEEGVTRFYLVMFNNLALDVEGFKIISDEASLAYILQVYIDGGELHFCFAINGEAIGAPFPDGWSNMEYNEEDDTETPIPMDTPPTIVIPEGAIMSADLATTSVFFDVLGGGSSAGGDTKITINGAEYWVDSTKLADAKSALNAAFEALQSGGTN